MKTWHFDSDEARARLTEAAHVWQGTPFRENSCARGRDGGVDCLRLVEHLMIAAGVVAATGAFPVEPMDYSLHAKESKILRWMRGEAGSPHSVMCSQIFAEQPEDTDPMVGDLVTFKIGHCVQHLGVCFGENTFYHCLRPEGAGFFRLDVPPYKPRIACYFRARTNPARFWV